MGIDMSYHGEAWIPPVQLPTSTEEFDTITRAAISAELRRQRERVQELLTRCSELVEENRRLKTTGSPLNVRLRKLDPSARVPTYANDSASGLDLYAMATVTLFPGETRLIKTGIAIELPPGYEAQVRPRSGMSSKGIRASFGTIDADYRGDVGVVLVNTTSEDYAVSVGDRVAQLVVMPVPRVALVEVETLSETPRGSAGFGSTGT